jgi:hypothetical protein
MSVAADPDHVEVSYDFADQRDVRRHGYQAPGGPAGAHGREAPVRSQLTRLLEGRLKAHSMAARYWVDDFEATSCPSSRPAD